MGIHRQIILAMVVVGLLIISIMGSFSIKTASDILDIRAQEFLAVLLERSARELNQQITITQNNTDALFDDFETYFDLNRLSRDPAYLGVYLEKIKPSVKLAAELNPSKTAFLRIYKPTDPANVLGGIFYADFNRDGVPEETDMSLLDPLIPQVTEIPQFPQESSDAPAYNWHVPSPSSLVSCYRPLYHSGQVIAVIGTAIKLDFITDRIRQIKYLNSGFVFLSTPDSHIIYHPTLAFGDPSQISIDAQGGTLNKDATVAPNLHFSMAKDAQGVKLIYGTTALENGWQLNIEIDQSDIKGGLASRFLGIIVAALIALTVSLIFAITTARKISTPYVRLSNEMKKVGQGDYDIQLQPADISRSDEIGVLSQTFLTMVQQTKQNFEAIQSYNDNLKSLVDERTEELKNANITLEASLAQTVDKQAQLLESNQLLQQSLETIEQTQLELARVEKIAALTYLVTGVAHKINTPLGNAFSSASFLHTCIKDYKGAGQDQGQVHSAADFAEFVDTADVVTSGLIRSLDVSIRLINRFKELAVIKSDAPVSKHPFRSVIDHQWYFARLQYADIPCNLEIDVPDNLEITCPDNVLESLFLELISNSLAHGGPLSAPLQITIQIRPLQGQEDREGFEIIYKDNGLGIAPELMDKLFTPFFTTKLSTNHDGLGLNMIYNLVLAVFNGEIQLITTDSPGLAYRIRLFESTRRTP